MNKKGFTLIELIVAIAIMGVLLVIAFPQVAKIQNENKTKKYETYKASMERAAKLYTDSNAKDMFGYQNSGCSKITYSDLEKSKLIKEIQEENTTCEGDNTYVYVRKTGQDNYIYETSIKCTKEDENGNEKVVYEDTLSGVCQNGEHTTPPEIDITGIKNGWTNKISTIKVEIRDDFKVDKNITIRYYFVKANTNDVVGKKYTHDFKNKEPKEKVSFTIPEKNTPKNIGQSVQLIIEPVKVKDIVGNTRTENERSSEIKLDTIAPTCTVDSKYGDQYGENYTSGEWSRLDVWSNPICTDVGSGCDDKGNSTTTTGATTNVTKKSGAWWTVGAEGQSTVTYYVKDKVGNETQCKTLEVNIDRTPPKCTNVLRLNSPTGTQVNATETAIAEYSDTVWYSPNCQDSLSGCNLMYTGSLVVPDCTGKPLTINNGSSKVIRDNQVWRVFTQPTLCGYTTSVVDNAGNMASCPTIAIWKAAKPTYHTCDSTVVANETGKRARTVRFTYDSRSCDDETKYRIYDMERYNCTCLVDSHDNKKYCGVASYERDTTHDQAVHQNQMVVYYKDTKNGKKACLNDGNPVNSYVEQVCKHGKATSEGYAWHSYKWYSGAIPNGGYKDFNSNLYWYHTGGNYDDRISKNSSIGAACEQACKHEYNLK